jgi:PAS domain S-box-containing protein
MSDYSTVNNTIFTIIILNVGIILMGNSSSKHGLYDNFNDFVDGVIISNYNGKILYINKRATEITKQYASVGKNIEILIPDERKSNHKIMMKDLGKGIMVNKNRNVSIIDADGRRIMVNVKFTLPTNEKIIILVISDKLDDLFNMYESTALLGSFDYNNVDNSVYCTRGLKNIYEIKHDNCKMDIKELFDNIHPDDKDIFLTKFNNMTRNSSDCISTSYRLICDTRIKYIGICVYLIELEGITIKRAIIRDESDHKITEMRLIEEKIKAETASKVKSSFVANISHEIRTPINGIIGMATLLQDSKTMNNEEKEFLDIIIQSSGLLLSIINNVLDFSRIESGKLVVENLKTNVTEFINKIHNNFQARLAKKYINFEIQYSIDFPEYLYLDQVKIEQILTNLLSNAIKFTNEDGIIELIIEYNEGTLTTSVGDGKGTLTFQVKDDGIGINSCMLEKLFKPFSQGDSSVTRRFGGSGLGLSICKNLVNILNGTINLTSEEGKGTCVTVSIPTDSFFIEKQDQDTRIILIAEDNEINQKVISLMLEKLDYKYIVYNNGQELLDDIKKQVLKYEQVVLLCDLHMPILSGYDTCKALRRNGYKFPIIAYTANGMFSEKEKCLEIGMNDFLLKPVLLDDLKKVLQHFFKK